MVSIGLLSNEQRNNMLKNGFRFVSATGTISEAWAYGSDIDRCEIVFTKAYKNLKVKLSPENAMSLKVMFLLATAIHPEFLVDNINLNSYSDLPW